VATVRGADQDHEIIDVTTSKRPKVLMVVANPTTSTATGWPIGFWAAELLRCALSCAGGGRVRGVAE